MLGKMHVNLGCYLLLVLAFISMIKVIDGFCPFFCLLVSLYPVFGLLLVNS